MLEDASHVLTLGGQGDYGKEKTDPDLPEPLPLFHLEGKKLFGNSSLLNRNGFLGSQKSQLEKDSGGSRQGRRVVRYEARV